MRERPTLLGVFMITMTFCFLLILLTSCGDSNVDRPTIDQTLVEVVSINGCMVYRFYDKGEYRYFTTCEGTVSGGHTTQSGKTSIFYPDSIQTTRKGI